MSLNIFKVLEAVISGDSRAKEMATALHSRMTREAAGGNKDCLHCQVTLLAHQHPSGLTEKCRSVGQVLGEMLAGFHDHELTQVQIESAANVAISMDAALRRDGRGQDTSPDETAPPTSSRSH